MNKRIEELIEQATDVYDNWHTGISVSTVDQKIFAELIIKECCKLVNEHVQVNNPNDCPLVLKIKDHFGVE